MPKYTNQQMLDFYMEAERAVLDGKSVRFNDGVVDRMVTMEDLPFIQRGRAQWQAAVNAEQARARGLPTFGGLGYSVARLDGN